MYMVCLEVSSSELYSPVKTDSSKTLKGKYCNKTTSKCCQQPWISLYHHVSNKTYPGFCYDQKLEFIT